MKARIYGMGGPTDLTDKVRGFGGNSSATFEVELDDGRTLQLTVYETGRYYMRGWGNVPKLLNNMDDLNVAGVLAHKPPLPVEQQGNW
jgi:hypothetical protein